MRSFNGKKDNEWLEVELVSGNHVLIENALDAASDFLLDIGDGPEWFAQRWNRWCKIAGRLTTFRPTLYDNSARLSCQCGRQIAANFYLELFLENCENSAN